ncbi:AI-2E family transporter [Bacteroides pyogenes]|uniref:AI-2E family transporter n=1 Tax=Bacteroides pyogenes TaxID=310300 RepID=UPI002A91E0A8|nr:AI-2E family transporter [Bacteroides pyogenes]MDY5433652.1 AI-2E family transporter [Bacteroides pyogenes]
MDFTDKYRKYSLISIILLIGIVILRQMTPFIGGLLGALTIYTLVRGQMFYLTKKRRMKRVIGATIITVEAILFFLVPLSLIVWMLVNKLQDINLDPQSFIAPIEQLAAAIRKKTGYDILGGDALSFLLAQLPCIGQAVMGGIGSFVINIFVLIFVLYFMLMGGERMEKYVSELLPFNKENRLNVTNEINMIIRSNAIGIPLLALIQGAVATVGFFIFGVPNAIILGVLTSIASVIPVVGSGIVWLPAAIYMALSDDWFGAIGIAAYGIIIVSNSDNLIRFIIQKQMADIHPLITVFGVVIGLPLFGFMGVIFGPLLLSLFFLFVDILKREYLDNGKIRFYK